MAESRRLLIIDDEIDLSLLLQAYFEKKMFDVFVANTVDKGEQLFAEYRPDLVFADNNLPDGEGWGAAVRWLVQHPGLFLVLISAFKTDAPAISSTLKYWILEKPVSFADLDKILIEFENSCRQADLQA